MSADVITALTLLFGTVFLCWSEWTWRRRIERKIDRIITRSLMMYIGSLVRMRRYAEDCGDERRAAELGNIIRAEMDGFTINTKVHEKKRDI